MWILPRQLHTSDFVPDMAALRLDSTELSEICARSLFVRSKPSPARTWSAKWKRDSWSQHLFGRILKPSLGSHFVTAWTSSLGAIPASHSAQPESASAQKTQDIFGPTSQTEFDFFAPASASSRMSKDTSASDSERSLESWNKLVIQRRGEYSARVKSGHRTRESGFLSWPTIRASEYKDTGPIGSKSHDHMLGKGYLCAVVTQDAANWLTPATVQIQRTDMQKRIDYRASIGRKYVPGSLEEQMQQHGLPAPANPSTDGSRPELSEQSQRNWQTFAHGTHNRGETPHRQVVRALVNGEKAQTQCLTVDQVFAEEIKGTNKQYWPTPTMQDGKQGGITPSQAVDGAGHTGLLHIAAIKSQQDWRTPTVAEEKNQNTSTQIYLQNQVGATPKAWATPQTRDAKGAEGRMIRDGKSTDLPSQTEVEQTGTWNRNNGKLNPRWVETLMGLPIGWTMPSCKSPVTIALTNCASLATESSQPQPSELLES